MRQDGVLALAARASHESGGCVLLLDEIDKAQERAEALLLDWLQSGRVPVAPGRHLTTRPEGCLVLVTSNAARELSEALLRRCTRVWMDPLPVPVQVRLLAERSGLPEGMVRALWVVAREAAQADGRALTLQEGHQLLAALGLCESADQLRALLAVKAASGPKGRAAIAKDGRVPALWGGLRLALAGCARRAA